MTSSLRRRARTAGLGAASILAISAASIFGLASAAHADYVSPDDLSIPDESGWFASADLEGEDPIAPGFAECSIIFPESGGGVGYEFARETRPTGLVDVTATIESFTGGVTHGGGTLGVQIDRVLVDGSGYGVADVFMEIPVGVHGFTLDSVVDVQDGPDLGLPVDPTVQDVLDALEASGDVYYILALHFSSTSAAEVQWLAFGSETYWFGTDAEWFLNDPSCGAVAPEPEPEPEPKPVPVVPATNELAATGGEGMVGLAGTGIVAGVLGLTLLLRRRTAA